MSDVEVFDYVVVGAGSAGAALASRLSEDPSCNVLLLEAGGTDKSIFFHVPLGVGKLVGNPEYTWQTETEPQAAMGGTRIHWPSGRVLGGSSSVNGMLAVRGNPAAYDAWAKANCPGWDAKSVLPWLMALENYPAGDGARRGKRGPIHIEELSPDPLSTAFLSACVEGGIPATKDYNDERGEGAGLFQMTMKNGLRCSSAKGYLSGARNRKNLVIRTGAVAQRINFSNKRAQSVAYRQSDGALKEARARCEILLCAGAIRSPQLLELSGIGHHKHLAAHGIPVVHHSPWVGENLRDHVMPRLNFECRRPYTVNDLLRNRVRMAMSMLRFAFRRDGLFGTTSVTALAFVRTSPEAKIPDARIQIALTSGTARLASSVKTGLDDFSGFHIGGYAIYPRSVGNLHIRSTDVNESPAIQPNYFADPYDQEVTVRTMKIIRHVANQPSLSEIISRHTRPSVDVKTDAELLEYAKKTSSTCFHPVGTCRMGSESDSVVDTNMRVYGVEALRVVDASIFPTLVASNTNIPTIMVGERAADFILRDRRA